MSLKKITFIMVAVAFVLALGACSSTRLTSVWKDAEYQGGTLEEVLVVGIGKSDRDRRMFEETFTQVFAQNNVNAHASSVPLPSEKDLTKEAIKAEAEKLGVEAIFVTHFHGVKTKTVYNPPQYGAYGRPDYYGRFGSYYPMVHGYVHSPGYYTEHEIVELESNLYDLKTEKLIWSAASETVDPGKAQDVIDSLAGKVMDSLRKSKLLP
jgi:hypothetical protein